MCSLTGEKPNFIDECPAFDPLPDTNMEEVGATPAYDARLYLASGGKRFANLIVDGIAYYFFTFVLALVTGLVVAVAFPEALNESDDSSLTLFSYALTIMVYVFYYTMMESVFGRTIGKMITGTKVVTHDGKTPSTGTVFRRSLSRLVPFEAFSFLGSDSRGWHDEWTDTYVVEKKGN